MSNREAPLAVPVRHRGKGTLRAAQAARDAVARGILDIAEHPFLIERLDGKRPILGEIRIHMHVENDICSDHVRRLTLVASQTELLRILDFDNRMGFKHFGISTSEMLPDAQVMPLLQRSAGPWAPRGAPCKSAKPPTSPRQSTCCSHARSTHLPPRPARARRRLDPMGRLPKMRCRSQMIETTNLFCREAFRMKFSTERSMIHENSRG